MANASEKKRSTTAVTTVQLYNQICLALYAVYFLLRVVWCWDSFGFGPFFVAITFSIVNFFALKMVQQALELGTPVSGPQDVLFINWAVQAFSVFTDKAYFLYLAIPAYLLYQYGGMIKSYMFPAGPVEVPVSEADLKRQAKKERQSARSAKLQGR